MEHSHDATDALLQNPLTRLLKESLWLFPTVETLHILGFIVLVGAVVMFDLRVLGLSKRLPVDDLARHLLVWSVGSALVVVPAGLLLFASDPLAYIANRAFQTKLLLIGAAGINAASFHLGPYRTVEHWRRGVPAPAQAKLHATLSLAIWISVVVCGRWIAYI